MTSHILGLKIVAYKAMQDLCHVILVVMLILSLTLILRMSVKN